MAVKPSSQIDWTTSNPAVRSEPTSGEKNTGWAIDQRPPREYMNWLFYNLDQWVKYFEDVTDAYIGFQAIYDAFVGTGGLATHATINAAMADVAAGARILVLDSATIDTEQRSTRNDVLVEFQPGVTYTKGLSTSCIKILADRVKIRGGRFSGFSGGGNKAIIIDATSDYCQIRDCYFQNCATEIDDGASTTSISGTITEA